MSQCKRCGESLFEETGLESLTPLYCPNCGAPILKEKSFATAANRIVRSYFHDLWTILTDPVRFFHNMRLDGGVARPLAFALVTHWLGIALGFIWKSGVMVGASSLGVFRSDFDSEKWNIIENWLIPWFTGISRVLVDPFTTSFHIFFSAGFVFLGGWLLIPRTVGDDLWSKRVNWEVSVRVVAFAMTPSILLGVPLLGSVIATVYGFILTVIGVREAFDTGTGSAIVIVLLPNLLLLGAMLLIVYFVMIPFAML